MGNGTDLTDDIVQPLTGIRFSDASGIDDFFQQRKGQHYIRWFNARLANHGPWAGVTLVDTPQNDLGFHQFWNQTGHMFGGDIGLLQFLSLMSIISNEVRGDFVPKTEKMGTARHPGMAYLFDAIPKSKRSYNTLAGSRTALECFNNDFFVGAHGALPLGSQLARTTDARWSNDVWPADCPTDPNPAVSGFVQQSDFMKFRGRGFIQTTGRDNYLPLIEYVQSHEGENSTIDFFKHKWSGKAPEQVAYESTNADWDALFQQTNLIIATEAIRVHSANSGNYLRLSPATAVLNGQGPGSVYYMGLRISGGAAYAQTFKLRVVAVLTATVAG